MVSEVPGIGRDVDDRPGDGTGREGGRGVWGGDRWLSQRDHCNVF